MSASPDGRSPAGRGGPTPDVATPGPPVRCRCTVVTLSSPGGDLVVLRVAGEVDLHSLPHLAAALDDVLDRRPDQLVVDLAGLTFCSTAGVSAIELAGRAAAANGIHHSVSGASAQVLRVWEALGLDDPSPRHATAAEALLAAIAHQTRHRPTGPGTTRPEGRRRHRRTHRALHVLGARPSDPS